MTVLCNVCTKGRYDTTLPLTLMAIAMQTLPPQKLVIFDDNDEPKDMRQVQTYQYLFEILLLKGIQWEWVYAQKKGQHFSHQTAQRMALEQGHTWVWRVDDDAVPEPDVLQTLYTNATLTPGCALTDTVGAVGGAVLTPPFSDTKNVTGKIEMISAEPNIQWNYIKEVKQVDHLHCTFLYRAGVADYNLELSRVAHREETLFTYGIKQKGYEVLVIPEANTWHMKNREGGIRTGVQAMFEHDEQIFQNILGSALRDQTIVVLDCGLGDHIVFKHVLPHIKNPIVYSCYPDIVPGFSIADAHRLYGDIEQYNIYRMMDQWHWKQSLEKAYRKMYGVDK